MKKKALFPGTFDPFHEGHFKVLSEALGIFDEIIVSVTNNINKTSETKIEDRQKQVIDKVKSLKNVSVIINEDKLTAELAKELGIKYLIRGLRNELDLTYEIQLNDANKYINEELTTMYFVLDKESRNLSSSMLKEMRHYKKEN